MVRPLYLDYSGAWLHVYSRGVDRHDIFLDDHDRHHFLDLLGVTIPQFRWRLHAYVLMSNHYHLLVEMTEPTLSRGMKKIGGDYARWFNKRHRRVGHLFQGRFKAHLIDRDEYLLSVVRYIVLNPVPAKTPSSRARRRAIAFASSVVTVRISFTRPGSHNGGMKPMPIPSIL